MEKACETKATVESLQIKIKNLEEQLRKKEEKIQELERFDRTTGLYNSKTVHELLEIEIKRARRGRLNLVIAVMNIDRHKTLRDIHGPHPIEKLMAVVGREFRQNFRETDITGCCGNNEFLAVFPGESLNASRIAVARAQTGIHLADPIPNIQINLNVGLVELADETPQELLDKARLALEKERKRAFT